MTFWIFCISFDFLTSISLSFSLVGRPESAGSTQAGQQSNSGFDLRQGEEMFLVFEAYIQAVGSTQPAVQWEPRVLSPRVMRLGREADCSPEYSVKVRMSGAVSPLPHVPS